MNDMSDLFFELIRVALGTQDRLSRPPTETEWEALFEMAVKQSLVGICFKGLDALGADSDDGFAKIGMGEDLYFNWMGMAAQITMKNELVNRQCVELQAMLSAVGLQSCILKGQGVGAFYMVAHANGLNEENDTVLSLYRQSGDIDVWITGDFETKIKIAKRIASIEHFTYVDSAWRVFPDTEVELHIRPASLRNLLANARFQKWSEKFEPDSNQVLNGIIVPPLEFNRVYLLLHCYRHAIGAGIGLRQLMDYYFCLRSERSSDEEMRRTVEVIDSLGLSKFAGAIMYVLQYVFGLEEEYMICEPLRRKGEYLLEQIVVGGNFGHYDDRFNGQKGFLRKLAKNMRYFKDYPGEILWAAPYKVYETLWVMTHKKFLQG